MHNSCLFGSVCLLSSVYLFSQSAYSMNMLFSKNKYPNRKLIIINGLIFVVSGSILISGGCFLNLYPHFLCSKMIKIIKNNKK